MNKRTDQAGSKEMEDKDSLKLIHELQVHQIELEMQNEELRRVQAELAASESKYRDLYEFAPIGYLTLDGSGKILEANLTSTALLGTERMYLANNRFQAYLDKNYIQEFNSFCSRVLESGEKQAAEFELSYTVRNREAHHWVLIEAQAMQGDICQGLKMAVIDISERKKMEEELMVAKEAAEAAVEAKAAFLANMSHELRTPLNAVIGFSSLLLADNLTPEQKEDIERIRNGGEALLSIISDILEFSKAEKEKVKLELQPISLRRCIEASLDMVAVQANDKGLNLAYTIAYGTPDTIISDPDRLRQILANLLSNAVKFTDKGDISVSISSKIIEGDKRQITFKVMDTGIGMPQDKMDRLFKPFTQLEYTLSRKRDGAGLGLAISKKLVELMGGEIWAESMEGQGSTFQFTIPVETLPSEQLDLGEKNKAAVYESISSQKPLSILVAEDNPSNQKVLVEMLKRLGYRADAVADGTEVLQALQIRPYDLIFMDIKMPEMDGIIATKEIRKLWPNNGPKVVAITAFAMDGDREMCIEAGMDDYIAKPVKVNDLATLLHNIPIKG